MNIFEKKSDKIFHRIKNLVSAVSRLKSLTKSGSLRVFVLLSLVSIAFNSVNQLKLAKFGYIPNGIPLFNPELPAFFHLIVQIVVYAFTGSTIYEVFRVTIGKYASMFAVLLYASDSQTILVVTSSPFWDFMTETFVFLQLLISLAFLKGRQISDTRLIRLGICLWGLTFIYIELQFFQKYQSGLFSRFGFSETNNNFAVVFTAVLVFLFSLTISAQVLNLSLLRLQKMRYSKLLQKEDIQFLVFSALNLILSAIFGRFSTSALPILLLLAGTVIFFRKNRLQKNIYLYLVFSLFNLILLFQSNFLGSNSIPKTFFFISGLLSAPNLAAGRTHGLVSFPVGFSDSGITNFIAIYKSQLSAFMDNLSLFIELVVENLTRSVDYITLGWVFSDRLFTGFSISQVLPSSILGYHQVPLIIFVALLMVIHIRTSTLILLVLLFIATLLTFSRLEAHQWWYLQLFGFWVCSFALVNIRSKFRSFSPSSFLALMPFFKKLGLLVVGVTLVLSGKALSEMHYNSELVSRIKMYSDEKWEKIDHKGSDLKKRNSFSYLISPRIKAVRIITNTACQHSNIQIRLSKKEDAVSNYRATLGGKDTILLPIPANWYDQIIIDFWKVNDTCDYTLESHYGINGMNHALFSSSFSRFPKANQDSLKKFSSPDKHVLEDIERRTEYKAHGDEFLINHRELNPLTAPIGTTAEGYMVENLKSLRVEPTQFKSIIISGELNAGTVVFAAKKSPGVYPSIEIIALVGYQISTHFLSWICDLIHFWGMRRIVMNQGIPHRTESGSYTPSISDLLMLVIKKYG